VRTCAVTAIVLATFVRSCSGTGARSGQIQAR
jgi:hypothetical protein